MTDRTEEQPPADAPLTFPDGRTRVWLLRHGETANPTVFHGAESDIGLGERGRRQAALLATIVPALKPAAVISSAMPRAHETAEPIAAACGLPLHVEPDLHERRVGALSGLPFEASNNLWQQTASRWAAGETRFAPPGAESFEDIRQRVVPVWNRLTERYVGASIVLIAHGVVCKVLMLTLADGFSVAHWRRLGSIRNAALHELVYNGGRSWRLARLNFLPSGLEDL
jgi:broad specificity phosphatase PhoE